MSDLIDRQVAIEAANAWVWLRSLNRTMSNTMSIQDVLQKLPSVQPTLYGYNIEHLELIARVLQKEDLPPERVAEALTDTGRIVSIVMDEFEKALRKAVEQCTI